jgi:hypothetical protein
MNSTNYNEVVLIEIERFFQEHTEEGYIFTRSLYILNVLGRPCRRTVSTEGSRKGASQSKTGSSYILTF